VKVFYAGLFDVGAMIATERSRNNSADELEAEACASARSGAQVHDFGNSEAGSRFVLEHSFEASLYPRLFSLHTHTHGLSLANKRPT
jgi:hypothetical protein